MKKMKSLFAVLVLAMILLPSCGEFWDTEEELSEEYFTREFVVSDNPDELRAILDDALEFGYHGVLNITIKDLTDESDYWGFAELWNTFDSEGYPDGHLGIYDELSMDVAIAPNRYLTHIGDYMFSECSALVNVVIPDGVTTLGYACFRGTDITTLRLPRSVYFVDEEACCNTLLREIDLRGVTHLGRSCFAFCGDLRSVWLSGSLEEIPQEAFYKCDVRELELPRYLKYIGAGAFSYNYLATVDIPEPVDYLGEDAFSSNNMEAIYFAGRVRNVVNVPREAMVYVRNVDYDYYYDKLPSARGRLKTW